MDNILQIASGRFISIPKTLKTKVLQHSLLKSVVYMLDSPLKCFLKFSKPAKISI